MIGDPVALRIRRAIERTPAALVRRFARAQTSFIADAQQGWNCMHHGIKGLTPKQRFAGTAVTASGGPRDNLAAMAMLDVMRKGDVLVIATGDDESGAVVGDHWAAVAKQRGAAGVVTDGLVRDADGIERLGPPTFSRGISPNAGYRNGPVVTDGLVRDADGIEKLGPPTFSRGISPNAGYRNGPGEVNATVSVGGVSVSPGDIVVGDRDGVVVVPRERAEAVAASLAEVTRRERQTEKQVAAGKRKRFWDPETFATRGVEYLD
jgi:4-hydroxy-4-methyl-2-oxoglutarate aldolase